MKQLAGLWLLASATLAFGQNALLVDLGGAWRWSGEDRPAFADPSFDDSAWRTFSLPMGEQLPFDGYSRVRSGWLRRRVHLPSGIDRDQLAVTLGVVADVYEVWANGQRIGQTGDFASHSEAHIPHPLTFDLPPAVIAADGELTLALHVKWVFWEPPVFRLEDRGPYVITLRRDAPRAAGAEQMGIWRERHVLGTMFGTVSLLIAVLSMLAWRNDPARRELGWFGLVSLVYAFNAIYHVLIINPSSQPYDRAGVAAFSAIAGCSMYPLFTHFVASALGFRSRWLHLVHWAGWSVLPLTTLLHGNILLGGNLPNLWSAGVAIALIVCSWMWIPLTRPTLRDHLFRLILLLQALGYAELWSRYLLNLPVLIPEWFRWGQYRLWREELFWLPVSITILALMVRRVAADRSERVRLAGELAAARTVQQLMFAPLGHGSPIEAVYEPALEFGGDFYQVFPLSDGGNLLAVGDVSGKGLKAAMVVSLLAGVLRNRHSDEPAAVLAELNRAVSVGLEGGFVTAAIARCASDGRVSIASAGHPAPYLAGEEVALVAGLPLGIDPDAAYHAQSLLIPCGEQLTFLSDGVVEAENAQRELFGFDRTRDISGQSAQEIADAAKSWGQNDDITVVTVRRSS